MKNFVKAGLVLAFLGLILTSCNCYRKISRKVGTVSTSSNPSLLALRGDSVKATYTVNFPANFFPRNALVRITPVLKYEGGEMLGHPRYVQGERVRGNNPTISLRNGGSFTDQVSFPFVPEASLAVLELRMEARCGRNPESNRMFNALPMTLVVAEGVSTIQLLADNFARVAYAPDNFKRTSQLSQEAKIMFLINKSNVRPEQLTREDIKLLEDFIREHANQPKSTLSDVYIKGYASPEGPLEFNNRLSRERGDNSKAALEKKFKNDHLPVIPKFDVDARGEDWEGFRQMVLESNIPEKDLIIRVLDSYQDPATRERELRNMSAVFEVLKVKILPELRRAQIMANVEVEGLTDSELKAAVASNVNQLSLEEMLFAATLFTDNATKEKIYKAAADKYNDWRAWNNLGAVLASQGKQNEAKAAFARAAQMNASANEVRNNQGAIALYEGNYAEAQRIFSSINTPEARYNMGLVALRQGRYDEAIRVLEGYNLAVAHAANGNYAAAKAAINCNCPKSSYLKAVIAAKEGDTNGVMTNLKAAVAGDPSFAQKATRNIDFARYFTNGDFISIVNGR